MKEIKEWFQEAKEQGHEWASAAIANHNDVLFDPKNSFAPAPKVSSLRNALVNGFYWMDSPEGFDYWYNICEALSM
jgi:hypothetical protein